MRIDKASLVELNLVMQSMTGFGRGTYNNEQWQATVEASSINRKQVEIVTNLPRSLQCLEPNVRQLTLPHISRGRVQLTIQLEKTSAEDSTQIRINHEIAKSLESAFSELSKSIRRDVFPTSGDFSRHPHIFESNDLDKIDPEIAWKTIEPALIQAIQSMNEMRSAEGIYLKQDFNQRLKALSDFTKSISELAPYRPQRQRELLEKRLSDIGISFHDNDDRLIKEIALFADRCDISEELTRLDSHFEKFHDYLNSTEATGRQLDFLCQELFREFNMIGSKANDAQIAQTVVEAKTEIEKIREQVQNIQ
ncbi:MAG: YicC/YloC family endoribonuclease [Akkermansiaceae bacterium]